MLLLLQLAGCCWRRCSRRRRMTARRAPTGRPCKSVSNSISCDRSPPQNSQGAGGDGAVIAPERRPGGLRLGGYAEGSNVTHLMSILQFVQGAAGDGAVVAAERQPGGPSLGGRSEAPPRPPREAVTASSSDRSSLHQADEQPSLARRSDDAPTAVSGTRCKAATLSTLSKITSLPPSGQGPLLYVLLSIASAAAQECCNLTRDTW